MFGTNTYGIKESFMRLGRFASLGATQTYMEHGEQPTKTAVTNLVTWVNEHEDAQVMMASVLMVVGLWWLARTLFSVLFNLICPVVMVLLAVVCVPQLRHLMLGQNYAAAINLLRAILLNLADSLKT